jgi:SAM-dependent methyltransferase
MTRKGLRQETIDTYNKSANELAEYYQSMGPRTQYIDTAFKLAGNPEAARVVELGCGNGRDAEEIVKRARWYLGADVSEELIKLAREHVPDAQFVAMDAVQFHFPENIDIVYAFASLLHLDRNEVRTVLHNAHGALRTGGIFYISLKYAPEYTERVQEDKYGTRLFYFYDADTITGLAGDGYEVALAERAMRGQTEWLEIALRKV